MTSVDTARCGAKTRAGTPCKNPGMANGRCKFHGGATPKGQRNAVTHGIYVKALTPEEWAVWEKIPLGILDDEIRLIRIQILRALKADKPELVDRFARTLNRLERSRHEIGGGSGTPAEIARQIRDALDDIEDATNGP